MIEGILLTGGASRRMGRDKASIDLGGETMAERAARVLLEVCDRVTVLGPQAVLGLSCIPDRETHGGPLAAMADFEPEGRLVLVLACDMPKMDAAVFRTLIDQIDDADCAVAVANGRIHPTVGVYKPSAFRRAREARTEAKRSLMAWLERLRVVKVELAPAYLLNVNADSDLNKFVNPAD